jgi:hypothetical protein
MRWVLWVQFTNLVLWELWIGRTPSGTVFRLEDLSLAPSDLAHRPPSKVLSDKEKGKVFLSLIKLHTMESGGIAPRIPKLVTVDSSSGQLHAPAALLLEMGAATGRSGRFQSAVTLLTELVVCVYHMKIILAADVKLKSPWKLFFLSACCLVCRAHSSVYAQQKHTPTMWLSVTNSHFVTSGLWQCVIKI